eukprot:scaffold201302_cov30-Tisochrysis_lutea.AAC.3
MFSERTTNPTWIPSACAVALPGQGIEYDCERCRRGAACMVPPPTWEGRRSRARPAATRSGRAAEVAVEQQQNRPPHSPRTNPRGRGAQGWPSHWRAPLHLPQSAIVTKDSTRMSERHGRWAVHRKRGCAHAGLREPCARHYLTPSRDSSAARSSPGPNPPLSAQMSREESSPAASSSYKSFASIISSVALSKRTCITRINGARSKPRQKGHAVDRGFARYDIAVNPEGQRVLEEHQGSR